MRTKRGSCYQQQDESMKRIRTYTANNNRSVAKRRGGGEHDVPREKMEPGDSRKRMKMSPALSRVDEEAEEERRGEGVAETDLFDALPDDLVVYILCKLSSSASSPADLINVLMTSKRFNGLGLGSMVLAKASPRTFEIKAKSWSDSTQRFLKRCADSGNFDACYTLGMIRFYCLENRAGGASMMAKSAINSHAQALYSLAVIQFNGSGGSKYDKDLRAGVALCARAASRGHVDALRELGHCLHDGYGVRQNIAEGRRFLLQANARELAAAKSCHHPDAVAFTRSGLLIGSRCKPLVPEAHPANGFLVEWFAGRVGEPGPGLRMCSHGGCGRPETRPHEFRRCSVCGTANYCSRACQALDWRIRHQVECAPMER